MPDNLLLIEDDGFKAKRIVSVIQARFPEIRIDISRSVSSGLSALLAGNYPVVLLDMSLSTFDVGARESGGRPQNFGGFTVLEHMLRRKWSIPVLVVTQFVSFERGTRELTLPDLRQELEEKFSQIYRGLIFYDSRETVWEGELCNMLEPFLSGLS